MVDRAQLLSELATQREKLELHVRALTADELDRACTASEDPGGADWTPRDHLAHLLRIEKAFLGMARLTLAGDERPIKISGATFEERLASVHRDNEAHVRKLADLSVDQLLQEHSAARADTLAFIASISDDDLTTPIPGAPWGDGTIAGVLHANSGHERQHLAWVDEGLAARA